MNQKNFVSLFLMLLAIWVKNIGGSTLVTTIVSIVLIVFALFYGIYGYILTKE